MLIDNSIIESATDLKLTENVCFDNIGLSFHHYKNMICFLDNDKFIPAVEENESITGLFITPDLKLLLKRNDIKYITVDDPRLSFYQLYNYVAKASYIKTHSIIDSSAVINKTAYVSDYNVIIGKNVVIEPNVTILPDVEIGDNCVIGANSVLGSEGFEFKRTSKGVLPVFHDGKVILKNNVDIGSNTCIDKGIMSVNTTIGENTKIDNLVHISHSVTIGKNCFIVACAMIAGSVIIEDDVWVGPNANIAPQVKIGKAGFVTLGSVVTKSVLENEWVTGNFAISHAKFLEVFKKNLK